MSSSTSSFRNELKVVCLVLAVLLACELLIRGREDALSLDLRHTKEIPAISQQLSEAKENRVLFLGNSMTRYGVNPSVFEDEMRAHGVGPLRVARVFPDATSVTDWYYAFKHYFIDAGHPPDVLIVGFAGGDLQVEHAVEPARLARYYSSARDIPEVFKEDVRDFDGRFEFLLADVSSSFANRTRVRTRVLDSLIPNYRDSAQQLNRAMKMTDKKNSSNQQPTYRRLEQFINLAKQHGVKVIFVAMPIREPYDLDAQLREKIEAGGMMLLDCRAIEGLGPNDYADELHLNPDGATLYSRFLARQLAARFPLNRQDSSSVAAGGGQ